MSNNSDLRVWIIAGGDRFYDNMASMIGFRINPWIKWCWKYLTPAFCLVGNIRCYLTYFILTPKLSSLKKPNFIIPLR